MEKSGLGTRPLNVCVSKKSDMEFCLSVALGIKMEMASLTFL